MILNVSELFRSIQGESSFIGYPCAFVRLAGCNLRCRYCDTSYAQTAGDDMSFDAILERIQNYGTNLVEITGGEPLLQEETPMLASTLIERGHQVLVETNGTQDISVLPEKVVTIMDIKCPSSGESHRTRWENIWKLRPTDEVKFVISDRHDYEWARGIIRENFGNKKAQVLISTVFGEIPSRNVVAWLLEDKLPVRFQLQIHRYIWPHETRGV
jgi:7-carboxy-7-deazaguanine synthase